MINTPETTSPTVLGTIESGRFLSQMLDDRLLAMKDLSIRYPQGVTVRLPGRQLHLVSDPQRVRTLLVENSGKYHKGLGQAEATAILGAGLLTSEAGAWRAQRTAINPLLSARRVQGHSAEILELAGEALDGMQVPITNRVRLNLAEHLAAYTIGCLGRVLGFQAPPIGPLIAALEVVQDHAMFQATTQARIPRRAQLWSAARVSRARRELDRISENVINSLNAEHKDAAWATRDGMVSLLLAGYETTASTLGWVLYYLAQEPDLQQELADEAEKHTSHRPLASAVFRETLRLRPPVWLISRRAVEDDNLEGMNIRAGDDVAVCLPAVHARIEATQFDPKRFMANNPAVADYIPFGAGPRGCPGGGLAQMEAVTWISEACRRFEFGRVLGKSFEHSARLSQSVHDGIECWVQRR